MKDLLQILYNSFFLSFVGCLAHLSQIITALSHHGCKLASFYQQTFAETQSIASFLSALVIIAQLIHLQHEEITHSECCNSIELSQFQSAKN